MNTKSTLQTKSLPYFPVLSHGKSTRTVTKHFTNLAMYMHQQSYSLLSWLIYQSRADNTIVYSTQLLIKFKESIVAAAKTYTPDEPFKADIKVIRGVFRLLAENGYLLPTYDKKVYLINPMLSYHPEYLSAANYKKMCEEYQEIYSHIPSNFTEDRVKSFTKRYAESVNSVIRKKIVK